MLLLLFYDGGVKHRVVHEFSRRGPYAAPELCAMMGTKLIFFTDAARAKPATVRSRRSTNEIHERVLLLL